jgi:hypothetical protein
MERTNTDITMHWRGFEITIPKGTAITHTTACGYDENYNFVNEFGWLKNHPYYSFAMLHDALHYGINVDREYVSHE